MASIQYWENGKSINAVSAESEHKYNATHLARLLKCSSAAIKEHLYPSEWHHTSGYFNETDYYCEPFLLYVAGVIDTSTLNDLLNYVVDEDVYDPESDTIPAKMQEAQELLHLLREYGKDAEKEVWENCKVTWLEWFGTRKRPLCEEYTEERCAVEFNGKCTYTISTPSGKKFRKRRNTNGFHIQTKDGHRIV